MGRAGRYEEGGVSGGTVRGDTGWGHVGGAPVQEQLGCCSLARIDKKGVGTETVGERYGP